jgi:hypothetical protein
MEQDACTAASALRSTSGGGGASRLVAATNTQLSPVVEGRTEDLRAPLFWLAPRPPFQGHWRR